LNDIVLFWDLYIIRETQRLFDFKKMLYLKNI